MLCYKQFVHIVQLHIFFTIHTFQLNLDTRTLIRVYLTLGYFPSVLSSPLIFHSIGCSIKVCLPNPPPVLSKARSSRTVCNSRALFFVHQDLTVHVSFYTVRRCSVWGLVPPYGRHSSEESWMGGLYGNGNGSSG